MRNLVEQASNWLQSEACRSGSIVERTNAVVLAFRSYIYWKKNRKSVITLGFHYL